MKAYYRVMLGAQSVYAADCFVGKFIGTDFGISQDLTDKLLEDRTTFSQEFIPIFLTGHPEKTKIAAGLACGALWTVSKGIKQGDIVLCPDGTGQYHVGEVTGSYYYHPDGPLPHRRPVKWRQSIDRNEMSDALKNSAGAIGTISNITGYHDEIERLLAGVAPPTVVSTDATVEDAAAFVMEKHLEDFLVENWPQTDLGKEFDIYVEDGECVGQQYPTDTGPLDILAISKDKNTLLIVELKKGKASDLVVGQTLRYMGFVKEQLAEEGQVVKGVIIALEDDQKIRRALAMVPSIQFFRYQISFKLVKA